MSETKTAEVVPETPQDKALARAEARDVEIGAGGALAPKGMDDQLKVAKWAHASGLLPAAISSVAQAWMVMERGAELGFPGLTAFEFLYIVNAQVRLKPAGAKAKALASGLLEDAKEETEGTGESMLARVTLKRRGLPTPIVGEFSMFDAKKAQLIRSGSAWEKYPKRMLLARARGFAYADGFPDVCGGLQIREVFDLDPGESLEQGGTIGRRAELPPTPPSTPDPLLEELAGPSVPPAVAEAARPY